MALSFSQKLSAARLMVSGVREFSDDLKKVGFDETKIEEIEKLFNDAQALDNEQEALKAKLRLRFRCSERRCALMLDSLAVWLWCDDTPEPSSVSASCIVCVLFEQAVNGR